MTPQTAMVNVTFNGNPCQAHAGATILSAAAANRIYIPSLCSHPDLPPFKDLPVAARVFRGNTCYVNEPTADDQSRRIDNPQSSIINRQPSIPEGCGLCVVEVDRQPEPVRACQTPVAAGMVVRTDTETLRASRQASLMSILARHPHACLTCAQREGCSLEDCSTNVPKQERCCSRFHDCELRRVAEYVGIKDDTPRYRPAGLPVLNDEPLLSRDFNLCIDCARCVRICNQVRGVEALGIAHNRGRLVVGSLAPTLINSGCKFCGACVEVCPTGCLTDKGARAGDREQWLVPCVHACPAGVDVPGYIRRIANGDFKAGAALVWETLPLANTLGHICLHLCECECRRREIDEPIAICALKRFALEAGSDPFSEPLAKPPETGKRIAVIGAGPAGLAAGCFLRLQGHSVTIFEAAQSPGGMPALSIPTYRLPPAVLQKDLAVIGNLGVEIRTGHRLPLDALSQGLVPGETIELLGERFDALLIALGLPDSKRIAIDGSHLNGVFWGLEFLRGVKAGDTFDLGQNIVIVGGGNVAIDAAMTALRVATGPGKDRPPTLRLVCLENREQMPAYAHEIEKAEAEGICITPGWGPAAILGAQGAVTGVEFRRCLAVFDQQHNFAPTFDDEQRMTLGADAVILAIGQAPPENVPAEQRGVFLAGDIASGSGGGSAVQAVASGRAAAERIDRYLGGDGNVSLQLCDHPPTSLWIGREEGFAPRARVPPPCAAPEQRRRDFRQIEGSYSPEQAVAEARRCLQCDLRLMISPPPLPPERWLELARLTVEQVPAVEGVLVLANADKKPVLIKGTADLRAELLEKLDSGYPARFFLWEQDRMYTKRESELIQQHLTRYGELPGGGEDELDDLF